MKYSIFSVQDHHPSQARSLTQLYQQVLQQAQWADQLGYDSFFVAEHHFHEYGVVPNPAVLLAAMAQRTQRIKLGSAIAILTFHHPLEVAENFAMLDVLSNGRAVLGVGSGYLKHEFDGYAIAPEEKRARFDENLHILKRALAGERITHQGQFLQLNEVAINVHPIKPIPIYVAILRREAAYHVGRQGHNMICVPYASVENFNQVAELIAEYKRGYRESNAVDAASGGEALVALHTHIAADDEKARARAETAFNLYVNTRLYASKQGYADILHSGLSLFGGVKTVQEKIRALQSMGVDHVLTLHNFGMLAPQIVHDSMQLMAQEVMPLLADERL